jgi:hypothetical protein
MKLHPIQYWSLLHACCVKVANQTGEDFQTVVSGSRLLSETFGIPPHTAVGVYLDGWKAVTVAMRKDQGVTLQ